MKIAVLGSASSSVGKAPFHDERYKEWIEGRTQSVAVAHGQVSGEWQIWGCSPGCWAVIPRATRWFEVHRWEPGQEWFSPQYQQFLRDFKGIVYTGAVIPEIPGHVVYPIDEMEEKFSSYFMTSSLSLMTALAIDTIEKIRRARDTHRQVKWMKEREAARITAGAPEPRYGASMVYHHLPVGIDPAELDKDDSDDVIGLWGVDMAANEEYAYQRPGCQFFILEAQRRGIGVYLPPESDLMRPMPVYGISEWDHNYIKLTARARELNAKSGAMQQQLEQAKQQIAGLQGEQHALQYFVQTWTSPYGMQHGMIMRQEPGTGLGGGITSYDGRPITRMNLGARDKPAEVLEALTEPADVQLGKELAARLDAEAVARKANVQPADMLNTVLAEAAVAREHSKILQDQSQPGEATATTLRRIIGERDAALRPKKKAKRRR